MPQVAGMPHTKGKQRLTAHEERALTVAAMGDPRTVRRALAGERVQPMALERIRTALDARGLAHLLSGAPPSTPPVGGPPVSRDPGPVDAGAALAAGCEELLGVREGAPPSSRRTTIVVEVTVREVDDPALRARIGRLLVRILWDEPAQRYDGAVGEVNP